MAPPLPLRRGGQAPCAPMASVRQWPHRRVWTKPHDVIVTLASTRSEHGTPGPRRRQARSPAAREPNTPGCQPDERLSSRPSAAGWSEAVRGTGVPRAAKGAVELRNPRNEECDGMPMVRPRPPTGPVALRGGRHGAATAPPARGPGTVFANGVGSAMASPPRVDHANMRHEGNLRAISACAHPD
jgi:hypothetical protein